MNTKFTHSGFTLIELLIVVAIIAILAAIAIPNFLLAQTRAKISKNKAGLAAGITAVESYAIDNNEYPPMRLWSTGSGNSPLHYQFPYECTTPIAYITKWPTDVFNRYAGGYDNLPIRYTKPGFGFTDGSPVGDLTAWYAVNYEVPDVTYLVNNESEAPIKFGLWADGPDILIWNTSQDKQPFVKTCWYDPTNGTVSRGFVVKLQGGRTSD